MAVFCYVDLPAELRQNVLHVLLDDCKIVVGPGGKHAVAPTDLWLVSKAFTHDTEEALKSWRHPQETVYRILSPIYWDDDSDLETLLNVAAKYNPSRPLGEITISIVEFACFNLDVLRSLHAPLQCEEEDDDIASLVRIHQDSMAEPTDGMFLYDRVRRTFCDGYDLDDQEPLKNIAIDVLVLCSLFWEELYSRIGKAIPIVRLDCTHFPYRLRCDGWCCYLDPQWWPGIGLFLRDLPKGMVRRLEIIGLQEHVRELCGDRIIEHEEYGEKYSVGVEEGALVVQPRIGREEGTDDEEDLSEEDVD